MERVHSSVRRPRWVLPVVVALLLSGCVVRRDSLAPGCIEYWGPAPIGGCFGKTVIRDLEVGDAPECLAIEVNNCNGGVLEVRSSCGETLILGGVEIGPGDGSVALDVQGESGGQWLLVETGSNFALYAPQKDEQVQVLGTLGSDELSISFVKTKALCD